jgi:ABC-type bacteriocin/lantibiotic exporter with double-glycine peptidase domain
MKEEISLRPIQRFYRLLALDRKDIYYIYVYAIFSGLITLGVPLGVQAIIGLIAGGAMSASVFMLILIVAGATAMVGVLKIMQITVTETIQRRIFTRSAFDFAYRIPRLKMESLIQHYPPELINRFFDTLTVQKGMPKILVEFSTAVLQIIFGLLLISFYHPFFIPFSLTLAIVVALILRYTSSQGVATSLKESKSKYQVAYWLEEIARAMNTFKLSGGSTFSLDKMDRLVCEYLDNRHKHFKVLIFQYGTIVAFKTIVAGGLLLLGSYLVINNQINIGQFVAAEIVIILVMNSVEKLILTMETIYDVLTGLEKLANVTDLPIEPAEGEHFEQIDTGKGIAVKADKLFFRHENQEQDIIKGLCLEVNSGEKLCIAGYNSAGKNSFLRILAGLYTHYRGTITYNGFPLRNLNLESLRQHIGDYFLQEDIFQGSVMENITFSNKKVGIDQVVRVAQRIGLSDYIEQLPDAYDTMLQPEGRNVPQNIRTRIILARCMVSNPRMLVVEGFFHGIQLEDRIMIARFLMDREENRTVIALTDDPILASYCDRVVVMKDGIIVTEGTFEQIRKSEHFNHIFAYGGQVDAYGRNAGKSKG